MCFLLACALCLCDELPSEPHYINIDVDRFLLDIVNNTFGEQNPSMSLKNYIGTFDKPGEYQYVFREKGNIETGQNRIFYRVIGTPAEIEKLNAFVAYATVSVNVSDDKTIFVMLTKRANYYQLSTFWVTIICIIIFLAAAITAYTLWHCDRYDLDPNNSLLFVTEGSRIVNGE